MTRRTAARTLAGFGLLAIAAAMPAVSAAAQDPATTVLGGRRPMDPNTPIIQEAGAFLAAHLGGTLASVDAAQSWGGVPAHPIEITLTDGSRWSATIRLQREPRFAVSGEPVQLAPPTGEGDEVDTGSNQAPEEDE